MQGRSNLPATEDIRQFLSEAFDDEEIITLCFDHFRPVHNDFATGMTKRLKIQLLLDYCQRYDVISNLLAAIQKARPEQYEKQFPQNPQVQVPPEVSKPQRDPRQVFISHADEDAEFAHRLASDLQQRGWRTWNAPDSIRPGEKWVEAINRGLEESGVFTLVLTPAAVKSRWVQSETYVAIGFEHEGHLKFIPLDVERCDLPSLWTVYQRVPFRGHYEDGLAKLCGELEEGQEERARREKAVQERAKRKVLQEEARRTANILVVDRERDICDVMSLVLTNSNYAVQTTTSGKQVLQILETAQIDLVIANHITDDISGFQLLKEIGKETPSLPVVIMSAYARSDSVIEALRHGAADYLQKPFSPDELYLVVERAIAESKERTV
jgi:CheY-like chemotaxis protein